MTHAQAAHQFEDKEALEVQKVQEDEMFQFIEENQHEGDMKILGGDFNTQLGIEILISKAKQHGFEAIEKLDMWTAEVVYDADGNEIGSKVPLLRDEILEKGERIERENLDWVFVKNVKEVKTFRCNVQPKSKEIKALSDHKSICFEIPRTCGGDEIVTTTSPLIKDI